MYHNDPDREHRKCIKRPEINNTENVQNEPKINNCRKCI